MSGPSDRRFDLNLVEEVATPSPDNIWRLSFLSHTGPLTVGDSGMKNDMTAAVVTRNLLTPKDNRLLSKRSDELAVKDSLAPSIQCAGSVSNMAQRLFAQTCQVESLAAEVMSLKQEIRGLKHENKQLHRLAHDYATNMKRKLDQMKESDCQILLDHQRFVGLFQRHLLPSSSGAVRVMKLQMINLRCLLLLRFCPVLSLQMIPFRRLLFLGLYRLLRLLLSNLCECSILFVYFDSCICTYL
ncbi:hypothetical protein ACFX11_017758 [Malus domestica]